MHWLLEHIGQVVPPQMNDFAHEALYREAELVDLYVVRVHSAGIDTQIDLHQSGETSDPEAAAPHPEAASSGEQNG
eukprot:2050970-Prorocentrum_lima.AAC.1